MPVGMQGSDNANSSMTVSNKAIDMHETRQGYRCTEVPLQVQGSDKKKSKVHGSVRTQ